MKKAMLLLASTFALGVLTSCGGNSSGGNGGGAANSQQKALEGNDLIAYNALIGCVNDSKVGWHDKTSVRYVAAQVFLITAVEGLGGQIHCDLRATNAVGSYLTKHYQILLNTDLSYDAIYESNSSILMDNPNVDISAVNAKITQYWGL